MTAPDCTTCRAALGVNADTMLVCLDENCSEYEIPKTLSDVENEQEQAWYVAQRLAANPEWTPADDAGWPIAGPEEMTLGESIGAHRDEYDDVMGSDDL